MTIAFQLTMAKYGADVPDLWLLVLWLLPLAPFGWWLYTHDKLQTRREKMKRYFRLHPWASIGVTLATLVIVGSCIAGVSYTGWKMLTERHLHASVETAPRQQAPFPQTQPSQGIDETKAAPPPVESSPQVKPIPRAKAPKAPSVGITKVVPQSKQMAFSGGDARAPSMPPIKQDCGGGNCAATVGQQGGITAGQINLGPPPARLTWEAQSIVPPNSAPSKTTFKYENQVTVNVDRDTPVSIGVICDSPVSEIYGRLMGAVMKLNASFGEDVKDNKIGYVYWEGTQITPNNPLVITIWSNDPLSILRVQTATIKIPQQH
jgi:hypothetical protein